jgi:hypothetical protein
MSDLPAFPIRLAAGLVITVAIDTVVQLAWKIGVVLCPISRSRSPRLARC